MVNTWCPPRFQDPVNFPPGRLRVSDVLKNGLGDNEIKRVVSERKALQVLTPDAHSGSGTRRHIVQKFGTFVAGQWLERVMNGTLRLGLINFQFRAALYDLSKRIGLWNFQQAT